MFTIKNIKNTWSDILVGRGIAAINMEDKTRTEICI